ncbi:hypothetical protein GCM10020358_38720 [Amorphoplanes nipponensis]
MPAGAATGRLSVAPGAAAGGAGAGSATAGADPAPTETIVTAAQNAAIRMRKYKETPVRVGPEIADGRIVA